MKIDGRSIASNIFEDLQRTVSQLKKKGITPHVAVILVGDDPASHAYVRQKKLKGEAIGMKVTIHEFDSKVSENTLLSKVQQCNNDNNTHGVIIQQPLPSHIDPKKLVEATNPTKDVDGFHSQSRFTPPIAEATLMILKNVYTRSNPVQGYSFNKWLSTKHVTVIGKGETGGKPIADKLNSLGVQPLIVDSKTKDPHSLTKQADIIISCVGKPNIITKDKIQHGVILISVGMFKGEDGKLHGDYEEDDIKDIAVYYTPVPGGIGPVNVAMLLKNVIISAKK